MPTYAASTEVDSTRSRAEIEHILTRYGADQFLYGWVDREAIVGFRMHGRMIKLKLSMPDRNADEFKYTPARGYERSDADQRKAYDQAVRQRWRALALVIKAKLEAVEAGITTVEDEFLGATVLPNDTTVSEWLKPQLALAYETGDMPHSLPGLPEPGRNR